MKIVYFGCDPFISCFRRLVEDGHEITALYTFHNTHDWYCERNIVSLAQSLGVPVFYDRLDEAGAVRLFEQKCCDAFFSAEYNWKIPVPDLPGFRGVNVHNMLLPESPGFFPIETQLYLGKSYSGVTLHKLTPSFDGGDVLFSQRFDLPQGALVEQVYGKCAELAADAAGRIFSDLERAWASAVPQEGERLTRFITARERTITAQTSIGDALHLWRCFRTYCYARVGGAAYRVTDMRPFEGDFADQYLWQDGQRLLFKLKGGAVCLRAEEK